MQKQATGEGPELRNEVTVGQDCDKCRTPVDQRNPPEGLPGIPSLLNSANMLIVAVLYGEPPGSTLCALLNAGMVVVVAAFASPNRKIEQAAR